MFYSLIFCINVATSSIVHYFERHECCFPNMFGWIDAFWSPDGMVRHALVYYMNHSNASVQTWLCPAMTRIFIYEDSNIFEEHFPGGSYDADTQKVNCLIKIVPCKCARIISSLHRVICISILLSAFRQRFNQVISLTHSCGTKKKKKKTEKMAVREIKQKYLFWQSWPHILNT